MLSTRDPLQIRDAKSLKGRGWKKVFHANEIQKKVGVAILSEKHVFKTKTATKNKNKNKTKTATRVKETHYKMIKKSTQEDIAIVNIDEHSIEAPQCRKQTLTDIKGETDSNTIVVGDFSMPLTSTDRSLRHKINEETEALSDTLEQMNSTGIYRAFHPKAAECTFFSSAHGLFTRINHMLGNKVSLGKFNKTEIISSIFSDHIACRF